MKLLFGVWLAWALLVGAYLGNELFLSTAPRYDNGYNLFSLILLEGGGLLALLAGFALSRGFSKGPSALLLLCALSGGVTPGGGFLWFAATVVLSVVFFFLGVRADEDR
jgi:hypothetical protein